MPRTFVVEHEERNDLQHLAVFDQSEPAIVEYDPAAVGMDGYDGVILVGRGVADDDKLDVLCRDAGRRQGDVFGDSVVLAIALAGRECFERRAPFIGNAPLGKVARRLDRRNSPRG